MNKYKLFILGMLTAAVPGHSLNSKNCTEATQSLLSTNSKTPELSLEPLRELLNWDGYDLKDFNENSEKELAKDADEYQKFKFARHSLQKEKVAFQFFEMIPLIPHRKPQWIALITPDRSSLLGRTALGLAKNHRGFLVIDPKLEEDTTASIVKERNFNLLVMQLSVRSLATNDRIQSSLKAVLAHESRHLFIEHPRSPPQFRLLRINYKATEGIHPQIAGKFPYSKHFRLDELWAYQTDLMSFVQKEVKAYIENKKSSPISKGYLGTPLNLAHVAERHHQKLAEQLKQIMKPEPNDGLHMNTYGEQGFIHFVNNQDLNLTMTKHSSTVDPEWKLEWAEDQGTKNERRYEISIPTSATTLRADTPLDSDHLKEVILALDRSATLAHQYAIATRKHLHQIKKQFAHVVREQDKVVGFRGPKEGPAYEQAKESVLKAYQALESMVLPKAWPQVPSKPLKWPRIDKKFSK